MLKVAKPSKTSEIGYFGRWVMISQEEGEQNSTLEYDIRKTSVSES